MASYELALRLSIRSLRESTSHRLDLYAANLQAEMDRFEYLPPVVSLNEHLVALLEQPMDTTMVGVVNRYLQTVASHAGASAIYAMDTNGLTLAASNWQQSNSFVGTNFAYRPYFQDAAKGAPGRFYGVGTVSREAGYYYAHAVVKNGHVIGVTAVKVSLERLDQAWGHEGEKIAVADSTGVVFLSSEPNWKYRTLRALSDETISRLAATRQYSEAGPLSPLSMREKIALENGASIVEVRTDPTEHQRSGSATDFLVQQNQVPGTDWRLLVFSKLAPAQVSARITSALAALSFVLAVLLVLYFQQRRRFFAQTVAARIALQQANDQLERNVQERTQALSDANLRLQDEIGERKRVEETLRATLEDLVHTARMAVLGQMSAGITHELNQPLAALRTLSGNTVVFLERGQHEEAASNLRIIGQLIDHMGKITSQLKTFARKSAVELRWVNVPAVVNDAMFLLCQSVPTAALCIEQRFEPKDLTAVCDANLLKQILLNLLTNAIDAVEGAVRPHILVHASVEDGVVRIEVHDNGPGISEDMSKHLFEPFYSTKGQGRGLGLGLTISADIVRKLSGTLTTGRSAALGGALFTIQLKAVQLESAHVH